MSKKCCAFYKFCILLCDRNARGILRAALNVIKLQYMKPNLHKFFLICFLSVGIFLSLQAQTDSTLYYTVKNTYDQLKKKHVPDSRTRLLEMQIDDFANNKYSFVTTEAAAKEELEKELQKIEEISAKVTLLPDESVGNTTKGIVNLSVANLRTRPSHAAEMATQVLMGTQIDLLTERGEDYRVRTPEGYIAWLPTSSVVPMTDAELENWRKTTKIIFIDDYGKSFKNPDIKKDRVSDLVYGNILLLKGETDGFYKVEYPDKRIAYVKKDQAEDFDSWLASRKATQENIIKSAKTMLGIPYLWGGTSVKGVDCSGFTKTSFFMNGIVIPRDASQQVLAGKAIDILDKDGNFDSEKALKNLEPADLLFFAAGKASSPNARVTHVAIYIGDGEFIHSAGTVRINSMLKDAHNYDDFQTRTIVGARRYVDQNDQQIQKITTHKYYQ